MDLNICPICGSNYILDEKQNRFYCRYCGHIQAAHPMSNEETTLLYNASQKLRLADFDEARELYEDIVRSFPENAEAYWGLTLCEYGIKYEDDYDGKKIPTCYSARYESFLENRNYKKALEYADEQLKNYYISQANRIEEIRKEWVNKAAKEPAYDIFLSFKDSEDGERTTDSYDAHELYNILTGLGYRVFFSRVTLKDKSGENYEPYIFAALNSAPLMLVFASKPEYINATWVRNEWMRYLARIRNKQKREDSLCVVVKGFSPSSLPSALKNRQMLMYDEITFIKNLEAYVDKVLRASRTITPTIQRKEVAVSKKKGKKSIEAIETVSATTMIKQPRHSHTEDVSKRQIGSYQIPVLSASEESKLTEAEIYLSTKNFEKAKQIYESVLAANPTNPKALLERLLADAQQLTLRDWIANCLPTQNNIAPVLEIINYSPAETAYPLLDAYASYTLVLAKKEQYKRCRSLYERIARYDAPSINELHLKLFSQVMTKPLNEDSIGVVKAVLPYLVSNEEEYKRALLTVSRECIKLDLFADAKTFMGTYATYYDFNADIYLLSLQASLHQKTVSGVFAALIRDHDFDPLCKDLPLDEKDIDVLFGKQVDYALMLIEKKPESALEFIKFLLSYRYTRRDEFIRRGIALCIHYPGEYTAPLLDAFLSTYTGDMIDDYIQAYIDFIAACLDKQLFDAASKYVGKLQETAQDDKRVYDFKIALQCQVDPAHLKDGIHRLSDYSDLESLIALRGEGKVLPLIRPYLIACLNSPNIKEAAVVFDAICAYFPKEEDAEMMAYIKKMGEICHKKREFELAGKYYSIVVTHNTMDHASYWALLQAKLKCNDDNGLIRQEVPLSEFIEFENAKLSAGGDKAALTRYITCDTKQKEWASSADKKRTIKAAKQVRRKKAKKIFIIIAVLGAVTITGLVALLGVLHFVVMPQKMISEATSLVLQQRYDIAIANLEGITYGESGNVRNMAYAGKAFSAKRYEEGISYVLNAGGTVDVVFDPNGGEADTTRQVIKPRAAFINNNAYKEGYDDFEWILTNFALHIDGASYAASLSFRAYYF